MKQKITNNDIQKLLTRKDVAARLVVSERTVARYQQSGQLEPILISRRIVRYTPETVENFINQATPNGGGES